MVVAAASTDGIREVRCYCRTEESLGYWSSFLHQELAAFCACSLAVSILSPAGISGLPLEVREGGEGRSASCIKEEKPAEHSSVNQIYEGWD